MGNVIHKVNTEVPTKAKIRVIWEDSPENYTQERSRRIAKHISCV